MNNMNDSQDIVKAFLLQIGENPEREGLIDTPRRVAKMWQEIFYGYDETKKPIITTFDNRNDGIVYDQMITDSGMFHSRCEHHIEIFEGRYFFGYIPGSKVLGLSKVARTVDYFSAKLQVQERLVKQIVDHLEEALIDPVAIGLILQARHFCKEMRGVKKLGGVMTTTDLRGAFRQEPETRAEFISLFNA